VPSFAVSELARRFVTVALSGDGGDESFLGYQRYLGTVIAGHLDRLPRTLPAALSRAAAWLPRVGPRLPGVRLRRLSEVLLLNPRRRYYEWLTSDGGWKQSVYSPDFAEQTLKTPSTAILDIAYERSDAPTFVEQSAHADIQVYLPDDLLVKMDIASMAHSLEVRSPFLDHKVVEFAASLPSHLKLNGLVHKYIVKRAMKDVLPKDILRRSKRGFAIPLDHWFRHELREMAYDLLLDSRATGRGYFQAAAVRRLLDDHVHRRADHHHRLWSLLMLELWHRAYVDDRAAVAAPAAV
jgi:asparagine synthase (glutamine-hydrolysing)